MSTKKPRTRRGLTGPEVKALMVWTEGGPAPKPPARGVTMGQRRHGKTAPAPKPPAPSARMTDEDLDRALCNLKPADALDVFVHEARRARASEASKSQEVERLRGALLGADLCIGCKADAPMWPSPRGGYNPTLDPAQHHGRCRSLKARRALGVAAQEGESHE